MQAYKEEIQSHDVVSFDIFDTLLARNVATPVDVFSITQELFNQDSGFTLQDDFRPVRIEAEREARLGMVGADVTLDDIYHQLHNLRPDYPSYFIETLKEYELKAESAVLTRDLVADLYDYAVSLNKKIAIVSDMYLPKDAIIKFLKENGISKWDFLTVSCEDDTSKASGTSFVALNNMFPDSKIIHIGDNYHDDVVVARRYGINAIHIKSNVEIANDKGISPRANLIYERRIQVPKVAYIGQVQQSIIDGLIANHIVKYSDDVNKIIGFSTLGPLLLGFSQWLHESARADEVDKVLFLARDGNIMHKAYNLIYEKEALENEYIFGSRRALVFPSIKAFGGDDIRTFAQLDRGASLSATLETFNLDKDNPDLIKSAKKLGISLSNDKIDESNASKIETLLLDLKETILETVSKENKVVVEYLNWLGFKDSKKKIAVCDIGWNGSVRHVIEGYVGRLVPGYYLGLRNVDKTVIAGDKIKGYFDARKEFDWKEFAPVVAGGVEVIEFLFSNPDQGPIKKIIKDRNGSFEAPQGLHDFPELQRQMVRDIQASALEFISLYQQVSKRLPRSLWFIDRHSGLSNIVELIDRPGAQVAHAIGNAPYSTSVGSRPELIGAPTRSNVYYRTRWRGLKREWARSFWAQGFKKNAEARGLKRHRL